MTVDDLGKHRRRREALRTDQRQFRDVADSIGTTVCEVIASASEIAEAVKRLVGEVDGGPHRTVKADLETLNPFIESLIEKHGELLVGAGFVADPEFLEDAAHWMDWRLAGDNEFRQLEVSLDANDISNYDYINAEWFESPKQGADSAIVGPYVDFGGTNAYVVTITVPVRVDDVFLGVAGADLSVDRVEAVLRRMTRRLGLVAVVITPEGRVVASSIPRQYPGTLLRNLDSRRRVSRPADPAMRIFDCPGLPWRLVVLGCTDPGACELGCGRCASG